jgi:hypothetical protein
MKKIFLISIAFVFFGCQKTGIEKPNNLIEKEKMIDVLYDISLLEAIKGQNINGGITSKEINKYIFKKYKIDSVQLVKSNKYYASDVAEYKKMYQKVKERLDAENKKIEDKNTESNNPNDIQKSDTPTVY